MRRAAAATLLFAVIGCGGSPPAEEAAGSGQFPPGTDPTQAGKANPSSGNPTAPNTPAKPALEVLTEVVYILMKTWDGDDFMCTGALVAKDRVLTAAHCLETDLFESWEIVAPLAPRQPRVRAGNPGRFGGDYERPDQPDIGILQLEEPIDLPHYAELTDITSRVERGEKLTAVTIVRTDEELEAPFTSVDNLQLRSARELGYTFGFATQQFSKGGDSGAGLFLTENGHTTHKLVAVARNPEPKRQLDHFTRISPEFLKWLADGADTGTGTTTTRD